MTTVPATAVRVPELDGVRGLAVVLVLIVHFGGFSPSTKIEQWIASAFHFGWVGVDLFFSLSGYLITTILLESRNEPNYYTRFYYRRLLRIFPLYYAFLVFYFSISWILQSRPHPDQAWYWLYLSNVANSFGISDHNLSHFWSLAIEEQFYLVWPATVWLAGPRRLAWLALGTFSSSWGFRLWSLQYEIGAKEFAFKFTLCRLEAISLGALLACLLYLGLRHEVRRFLIPAATAGAVLTGIAIRWTGSTFYTAPWIVRLGYTGVAILSCCLIAWVLVGDSSNLLKTFRFQPLQQFGKYSYAIYVFHMPLSIAASKWKFSLLGNGPFRAVAFILLGTLASYTLAALSWRFFEEPLLRMRDKRGFQPQPKAIPKNSQVSTN